MSNKTLQTSPASLSDDALRDVLVEMQSALVDMALNSGALAIKTASSALAKTATAIVARVDKTLVSVAAADMPALTGLGTITEDSFNVVMFTVDSSGTVTATGGTEATTLAGVTFPAVPTDEAVLGFIIVNAVGAAFTGGTTALDAGSHVVTYVNTPFPFNPNVEVL